MTDTTSVRSPAVAGRFYPADGPELEALLDRLMGTRPSRSPSGVLLAMVPHAGYVYSGGVAGATYGEISVPEHVLLLGPNHTGRGAQRSLWGAGAWRTPLGDIPIADDLVESLRQHVQLSDDSEAHLYEHSLEVQLPFLKRLQPALCIAPVCLGRLTQEQCLELGAEFARALRDFNRPVLIVCSTDMSHYIPAKSAERLDRLALSHVQAVAPELLYETVTKNRISMCGFIPTTVGLSAARALGASEGRLVRYTNSGEVTGDFASVVAYAGAILS